MRLGASSISASAKVLGAKSFASKAMAVALGATLAVGSLSALAGCSNGAGSASSASSQSVKQVELDPSNPVALTVWHYYNGAQQIAFDNLLSEFNSTVGKEKGIYVEAYSQGSVSDLEKAVSASAQDAVGSSDLPDIFSTYADTAYSVQQSGKLVDLTQYISQDELSEYVDDYIQEGRFDGDDALYLLPVAKSTEVTMVDATDWEPFAQATGVTYDDLATQEGIARVAKLYYDYTDAQTPDIPNDGKAFYGRDSMSNYFVIGMKQMGTDIFDSDNGKAVLNLDKDKIRRLWDNYYVPYISGYYDSMGKFRSDDMKTGDVIAYTGSTSSAMYFPDQVISDDGTKAIDCKVLSAPIMEGGDSVYVQQGAGMAVTKSDDQHEYAACEFLKWFTAKENNLRFVSESAYMPVRKDANAIEVVDEVAADNNLKINAKVHQCLDVVLSDFDTTSFYTTRCFENGYATRKVLDYSLSDKAAADKAAVNEAIAGGTSRDDALAPYLGDEAFDQWYENLCAKLKSTAYNE